MNGLVPIAGASLLVASVLAIGSISEKRRRPSAIHKVKMGLGAKPDCFGAMYGGAKFLSKEVKAQMNEAAREYVTPPGGKMTWVTPSGQVGEFKPARTWLSSLGQVTAFKLAVQKMSGPERSVPGLITREVLAKIMPKCSWDIDPFPGSGYESMTQEQQHLWQSVWYLTRAAARQAGFRVGGKNPLKNLMIPSNGGTGLLIGRGYLDLPEVAIPGTGLPIDRRVELLVGDYTNTQLPRPPFFHAERLYASVVGEDPNTGGPVVEIIGTFDDKVARPKFSHKHGFDVGQRMSLYSSGTTGIRRIFAAGVQ